MAKSEGEQHYIDRGLGDGWEPYDSDDIDHWFSIDPQFYQCLIGEHDFEAHIVGDYFQFIAHFEEN